DRMLKRNLEQLQCVFLLQREGCIGRLKLPLFNRLRGLDSMLQKKILHEILVLLRDTLRERAVRHALLVLDREILWNEHVDAVRFAVDVIVDPFQLTLEQIRRETGRSEYSETPGAAHSSHHVPAVAEGQQREIDAEHFANRCIHSVKPPKNGVNSVHD